MRDQDATASGAAGSSSERLGTSKLSRDTWHCSRLALMCRLPSVSVVSGYSHSPASRAQCVLPHSLRSLGLQGPLDCVLPDD